MEHAQIDIYEATCEPWAEARESYVQPVSTIIIGENETTQQADADGHVVLATASTEDGGMKKKKSDDDGDLHNVFSDSRIDEIQGEIKRGTSQDVKRENIPEDTRISELQFESKVKQASIRVRYKRRLVAQNYGDEKAATIATKAPTVQHFKLRLVLLLAALLRKANT